MTRLHFYRCSIFILSLLLMLQGCKEEEGHGPIDTEGSAPAQIVHPKVENLPGAATISYDLPESKNLLYVKAEYEIRPGVLREAKSTFYGNSLSVEGFGKAGTYMVDLYTVGRNNKMSEPVRVTVEPLTPPLTQVFESLEIKEDWGGISLAVQNQYEADMMIDVITADDNGALGVVETFYTKTKHPQLAVRGFLPEKRIFGVTVKDHWDNRSDTLFKEVTPWFEEEIPKPFKRIDLPTDYTAAHNSGSAVVENIWDGSFAGAGFITVPGHGLPQWFTFDLKEKVKLSRLVYYQRLGANYLYNSGAVRNFELYGSNNPNPDGSFDESWTLLMECKSFKPSGTPAGSYTDEDLAYATAGEEFLIPTDAPPVRYLRWKTTANWGNATHVNIGEISVFGEIQSE